LTRRKITASDLDQFWTCSKAGGKNTNHEVPGKKTNPGLYPSRRSRKRTVPRTGGKKEREGKRTSAERRPGPKKVKMGPLGCFGEGGKKKRIGGQTRYATKRALGKVLKKFLSIFTVGGGWWEKNGIGGRKKTIN